MNDDAALLRSYAEEGSEDAFTALVRRHVDFVYATALRRVGGDTHLASDVAQQVFGTVARQAGKLTDVAVLSAWLHTATRNAAFNLVNSERRRRAREQVALDPAFAPGETAPEWERLKPVLDAAIDELPAPDREAVVLRFLEQRPFGEVGAALKVSSDAARMRTERALDKLRATLERRGITSTAAAVGAIISSQPLISAPAGLAGTIAASTFATAGAGAGGLTVTLASFMKLKTLFTGVALLLAFGVGLYVGLLQIETPPPRSALETPQHSQAIMDLRKENLSLRVELGQLKAANRKLFAPRPNPVPVAAVANAPTAPPESSQKTLVDRQKAKSIFNNLRQISAARDSFYLKQGRPAASLQELIGPGKEIEEFRAFDGEDYSRLSMLPWEPMVVTSPNGISAGINPDGTPVAPPSSAQDAELKRLMGPMQKALQAYKAANNGAEPPETETGGKALLSYFTTPQEAADFVEYLEALKQAGQLPP